MKKGKLIVIEGTDGSGKKTQTQLLIKRLNLEGIPAEHMSFPRYGTPSGRIIGQCYLGKNGLGEGDVAWFEEADKLDPLVASLYYAADRRAAVPEMERILSSGTNLVLDRYYQSNMAHQGGKIESDSKRGAFFEFERKFFNPIRLTMNLYMFILFMRSMFYNFINPFFFHTKNCTIASYSRNKIFLFFLNIRNERMFTIPAIKKKNIDGKIRN